ncbi:MAG TPA: hypothetical protein DCL61_26645 [Cyanobacteria bacterium UBA12227]|nr:hypothetical protein [Cyanobacteria bacterium UBA12227]HAX88727.1 hypothetical protein [Cyanobacteria bacterium UBA11370]HBY80182.1 hypothetical protein [Cyanobacteria bacterium UBA11148]
MNYNQKKVTKFVVITKQRSGSSWLIDLLNSHEDIRAFGEIFLDRPVEVQPWNQNTLPPIRFYEFKTFNSNFRPWITWQYLNMINSWTDKYQAVGFKLMYNHLWHYPEILSKLIFDQYKFIHLIRKNPLDNLLSIQHKKQTGLPHWVGNAEVKLQKVYLNPQFLINNLERHENQIYFARMMLRCLPLPVIQITYEFLYQNCQEALKTLGFFLSINPNSFSKSNFNKIAVGSYRDKIENYEEVKELLSSTRFQSLLD